MHRFIYRHIKIALFNLLLVASIGVILRYKIAFSLPFIDQKHLLHGHSHFAFAGWVSHALMALLINYLSTQHTEWRDKKYRYVLNLNLLTAYGMLISFPLQGYGLYSIIFSTLSIFVTYAFAWMYWKDLIRLKIKKVSHLWIKAALLFNVLSSVGAFSLAIMMATKNMHQNWYLASVYFFLHFQYNGWFLFACIALITEKYLTAASPKSLNTIFWLFASACLPAYFLSALWMPIPTWIYIIIVLAAFGQLAGWLLMLQQFKSQLFAKKVNPATLPGRLFILAAIAFSIKLLLQLGSTIPSLSTIAFGFRPIVIGYLHLILLGVISLFLIGYIMAENFISANKTTLNGINLFTAGVILNEILLMIQGVAALAYQPIAFINEGLLIVAGIMFTGLLLLNFSRQKNTK